MVDLVPDQGRPGAWMLLLDHFPQSFVDLADPRHLKFRYVRWLASIADIVAEPGAPIRALHLGGGALTLPRYVAATRPGSAQLVVDRDAALMALVQRVLPLPAAGGLHVHIADARDAIRTLPARSHDLVVTDVVNRTGVPARLASVEFATEAARVLDRNGQYALNVMDSAPFAFTRGVAATFCAVFGDVGLFCEPEVLRGDQIGNLILVGTNDRLPTRPPATRTTRTPSPVRLLSGEELSRFIGDAQPMPDTAAVDSPSIT
ncbi:fused MFS/spermidine synthase [Nonomuraea sp. B10E15]|uniref:spermidine synthase n=1 Tax=Nonomuraea sp. B10E15 TaxID=3153560 RepID=UPI00325C446E